VSQKGAYSNVTEADLPEIATHVEGEKVGRLCGKVEPDGEQVT
jgi:hypothetical protein